MNWHLPPFFHPAVTAPPSGAAAPPLAGAPGASFTGARSLWLKGTLRSLLITATILLAFGLHIHQSSQVMRVAVQREVRLHGLVGTIRQLNEVLTMSARMAAATGQRQWETRYLHYEPMLDNAIQEARALAPGAQSGQATAQTDAANMALVHMEKRSFELVRAGRLQDAQALLFSAAYERQKRIYADGMEALVTLLTGWSSQVLAVESRKLLWTLATIACLLPLLLWWERRITERNRHLVLQTDALSAHNFSLDQQVAAHTTALAEANARLMQEIAEHQRLEVALQEKTSALEQGNAQMRQLVDELQDAKARMEEEQASLQVVNQRLEQSYDVLKVAQQQLLQAEKMESVGRLAAGVAQQVKQPLTILLLGTEYLGKHLARDAEASPVVGDMRLAALRADEFLRSLLHVSTARELQLTSDSLNMIMEQSLSMLQSQLFHLTVNKELADGLPALRLDRKKMQQVFVNIVLNAVSAMPTGGTLTVRTSLRRMTADDTNLNATTPSFRIGDTAVVAEIEDTGTGIPPEQLGKVFEPFFTTKPTSEGAGLGLTVVKRIMEMHGGVIRLGNKSPHGVRVTLMLPLPGRDA